MEERKGKPCGKGWISKDKKCKGKSSLHNPLSLLTQSTSSLKRMRNIQKEINRIKYNKKESAVIVSQKTGEVLYRGREGTATSCDIDNPEQVKGNTLLHNHPTSVNGGRSNSFSLDDISLACGYQAKEILAVNERYEYRMSPPAGGWNQSFFEKKVAPAYSERLKEVRADVVQQVLKGTLKVDWLGRIKNKEADPYHEVWKRVAQDVGMKYSKIETGSRRKVDSISPLSIKNTKTGTVKKELADLVTVAVKRGIPVPVKILEISLSSPTEVKGKAVDAARKVYDYTLNVSTNFLTYGLDLSRTPRAAFKVKTDRLDAVRAGKTKNPECETGLSCRGEKGVGCISRTKKCRVRLNRISTPLERVKLKQLAQEEFGIRDQAEFKNQLDKMTIRELRVLGRDAGISNYGNLPKETLTTTLTNLKAIEMSKGDLVETGEDRIRKALNRREKEYLNLSPIDPSRVAMTKEEAAQKRAEEAIRKRRVQTTKKAASVIFPGASTVIDSFLKASSVEDKVVAGTLAGILTLQLYRSRKRDFEENYRKGIEEQAEIIYANDEMVGSEKNPGKEIRSLAEYYEKERLSYSDSSSFVGQFNGKKGDPLTLPAQDGNQWKRIAEMAKTGGRQEDDLDWQKVFQKKKLEEQGSTEIEQAERLARRKEMRFAKDEALLEEARRITKIAQEERDKIKQEIERLEGEAYKGIPEDQREGSIKKEFLGLGGRGLRIIDEVLTPKAREEEERALAPQLQSMEEAGFSKTEIKSQMQSVRREYRLKKTQEAIDASPTVTAKMPELKKALTDWDNFLSYNQSPHENSLGNKYKDSQLDVIAAQELEKRAKEEWDYTRDKSPASQKKLEKKAGQLAAAEIERRRNNPNIKQLPLLKDFGDIRDGKLTRYQAWVMAQYADTRSVTEASQNLRDNPEQYSLDAFKKQLKTAIVVGSEKGKSSEIIPMLEAMPEFKGTRFLPSENEFSMRNSIGSPDQTFFPYVERVGKYIKKGIPASNRIPGLNPSKADNLDAAKLAAKIVALDRYGIEPKIISQGVGGTILQEALDIVAASKDSKSLDRTRTVSFGTPRMHMTQRKRVQGLVNSYYGSDDFLGKNFGGRQKERLSNVKGTDYKDYVTSEDGKKKILELFS